MAELQRKSVSIIPRADKQNSQPALCCTPSARFGCAFGLATQLLIAHDARAAVREWQCVMRVLGCAGLRVRWRRSCGCARVGRTAYSPEHLDRFVDGREGCEANVAYIFLSRSRF